jgi:NAD(P)-dependent dehydrogenase (short-subunit alcohol dehydrogenase family)
MRKQGGGSIISTASLAGLQGYDGIHAYSGAKAAVVNVTRSAAIQLGPDRIRVNCICPGGINTPILYGTTPGGEKIMEKTLSKLQPIKRAGSPFDIANMALFLASDESEWITGAAMVVDGGAIAGESIRIAQQADTNALPPAGFAGPSFER